MDTNEELNAIGSTAVRQLRKKKLENGKPFLFWSNEFPKNQSYLEYPDRSIKIVTVRSDLKSFHIVSELTQNQINIIRSKLNLQLMPNLYIITSSNGAGKSTVGPEYLPKVIHSSYPVFDGRPALHKKT